MDLREIEQKIEQLAGVQAAVAEREGTIVVSGMVQTEGERIAAIEIAQELAGADRVVDDLEVLSVIPDEIDGQSLADVQPTDFMDTAPGTRDNEAIEPGDFTDQDILTNPAGASGPGYTAADEDISEGEEVYVPPTDPVRGPDNEVLGGFATTSMDEVQPIQGDEDMRDAILTELREDAATTDLEIQVQVRKGVVRLRGRVTDMLDAENAAAVAERVPGVVEVLEELDVEMQ